MDNAPLQKLIEEHLDSGVIPVSAFEVADPAIEAFRKKLQYTVYTGVIKAYWSEDRSTYVYDLQSLKKLLESMGVTILKNDPSSEDDYGTEEYCTCNKHKYDEHPCWYALEMDSEDKSRCSCCPYCEIECVACI